MREIRERARRYQARAEEMRGSHGSVDVLYVIADRDSEIGGGLMAGALAYRIFIWMLPFALVLIGGIGVAASVSESPSAAVRSLGMTGIVASSVAEASRESSRWYALIIGIPVLAYATRSLLKALIVVHRLVWGDLRRTVPKPSIAATMRLLALLVSYFLVKELARWAGIWSGSVALRVLAGMLLATGFWLLVSLGLPHHQSRVYDLLPGALAVGVGLELITDLGTYVIAPRVESSQSTYGALGLAATLLLGLYLVSRLVVASAVINAAVWDHRVQGRALPERVP